MKARQSNIHSMPLIMLFFKQFEAFFNCLFFFKLTFILCLAHFFLDQQAFLYQCFLATLAMLFVVMNFV